jgi:outer membrane protein OmpA-like peptidoglycan-associated protein
VTRSLPPGTYALRVRAPHFKPVDLPMTVPADAPRHETVVQLSPAEAGGTLIVDVRNEAGQPVAALVTLLGEGRKFTTSGDGVGSEPVPVGPSELSVWAEGYRPKRVTVEVGKDEKKTVQVVLELTRVVVLADRVEIRDKVFFDLDSARIKAASYNILDDVAATLENHPELRLVEVQGHTDDQGAEDYNLELSQRRAEAVRQYLVEQGIEADRLVARGYGESQPLQPGTTEDAREVNRRVVFKILAGPAGTVEPKPRPGRRR